MENVIVFGGNQAQNFCVYTVSVIKEQRSLGVGIKGGQDYRIKVRIHVCL